MKNKDKTKVNKITERKTMKQQYHENKGIFLTYFILRIMVVLVMVAQFFNGNYENMFLCVMTLIMFTIPSFIEKRIKIDVPDTLEIIIILFIFSAEILGEIKEYYLTIPYWDTILHTLNGFLAAAIGFSMIDLLNRSGKFLFKLSPLFVTLVAFCFSMTIGVLWEFFEFFMDVTFLTDMQKDTVISSISSVMLNPEGKNIAITLPIKSVVINGQPWNYGGYIDIGLIDTMKDMIVNFIGAVVYSIVGYLYIRGRSKGKFAKRFILTFKDDKNSTDDNGEDNEK